MQNLIGRGNFGEVYKGEWQGAPVALKTLLPGESIKEITLLSALNHPNIVRYFGIFQVSTT
jgi:serine/threonine protein kinase